MMAQCVKLLTATLASPIGLLVQVPGALLNQLPANAPGNVTENVSSPCTPVTHRGDQEGVSCFVLTQS